MECDSAFVLALAPWANRTGIPQQVPAARFWLTTRPRSPDDPRAVCLPNLSASSGTPGGYSSGFSVFRHAAKSKVRPAISAPRGLLRSLCSHSLSVPSRPWSLRGAAYQKPYSSTEEMS